MEPSPTYPLRLSSVTLRGVGSYLEGARLEVRPLTILCGKNGSGKSTWFKSLNLLRQSRQMGLLPFGFAPVETGGWHDHTNAYIKVSSSAEQDLRDGAKDVEFGPLGTIGLHCELTKDIVLGAVSGAEFDGETTTVAQAFLWEGVCSKGMRFRLRLAHPTRVYGDAPIGSLVELRINDTYTLRMSRSGEDTGYSASTAEAFVNGLAADGDTMLRLARVEVMEGYRGFKVIPHEESPIDEGVAKSLCVAMVERIRQLLDMLLSGYFFIDAVRHAPQDNDAGAPAAELRNSRYVGANGQATQRLERSFARNLMREVRSPHTGRLDQRFSAQDVTGWVVSSMIKKAATEPLSSPVRRIWDATSPVLQQRVLELYEKIKEHTRSGSIEGKNWDSEFTSLMVELLNDLLPQREFYKSEVWTGVGEEVQLLIVRGVGALGSDEVARLNRLLIEATFSATNGIRTSRGYLFETYYSFWLDRLIDVERSGTAAAYWPETARGLEEMPFGALVHDAPHPQPLALYQTDSCEPGAVYSHTCFGNTDMLVTSRPLSAGFHQISPIVVQAGLMKPGEVMAVENPEVHLHPSLQLEVAQFLVGHALSGRFIMIETHSDLVVRRVLRAVLDETLAQSAVSLNFVSLRTSAVGFASSRLEPMQVDQRGRISNWPEGFMDDDVKESRRLLDITYGTRPDIDSGEDAP